MLMTTVQLPGAVAYDSQRGANNLTANTDISFSIEFKKHLSDPSWSHEFSNHGKDRKCASKRTWDDNEYHVQDRKYVPYTIVEI